MAKWLERVHPYDGKERRFRHTDANVAEGSALVAEILGLDRPLPTEGLFFDLSFYSGGVGIIDRLAISVITSDQIWPNAMASISTKSPEDAGADAEWGSAFRHLIEAEDERRPHELRQAAAGFVNIERATFQAICLPTDFLFFGAQSNVNYWSVVWGSGECLNYLAYDQG